MYLPILEINSEEMPALALVCGDPRRAKLIADKLHNSRELSFAREYRTFVGEFNGVQLAVVSHGVGSAGAAVCFEELIRAGVTTLIRVGTAGSLSADIPPGSLVISTASAREEGLTRQLVPIGFPAIADGRVVAALTEASKKVLSEGSAEGATDSSRAMASSEALSAAPSITSAAEATSETVIRSGITVCVDAFFTGVEELPHKKYKQAGALAVEMEIAALYIVAALRRVRAGAIVTIDGFADSDLAEEYNPHTDVVSDAVERAIGIALHAIVRLSD